MAVESRLEIQSGDAYREFGVDLQLGNDASKMAYEASLHTHGNRAESFGKPEFLSDSFSGIRVYDFGLIPDVVTVKGTESADGIGTKPEIAERMRDFSTMAFDLFAMACDDIAIQGGEPTHITTILDVNKLNDKTIPMVLDLALGSILAAEAAGIAIFTGETAELGDRVNGYGNGLNINWNAVASGAIHRDRAITGSHLRAGDCLVGVADPGFRSNGASAVRKILKAAYGNYWHTKTPFGDGRKLGSVALAPSVIYSKLLVDATGGYDPSKAAKVTLNGAAHITGGGIPEKVGRMLQITGLGADITDPFDLPDIQRLCQEKARFALGRYMTDSELYATWHGGQGLVVATDQPDDFIELAAKHNMAAKQIGEITKSPGIRIRSEGVQTPGTILNFAIG